MEGLAGACRFAWNHYVSMLRDEYVAYGELRRFYKRGTARYSLSCSHFELCRRFTYLRRQYKWLNEYSSYIVRHSLKPIETTYRQFFRKEGGLPQFKAKHHSAPSFPLDFGNSAKLDGSWLHIQRIGYVRLVGNNPHPNGIPRSGTVKREGRKWYAYVSYEVDVPQRSHSNHAVGIDRNAGQIALSDGTIEHAPDASRLEKRKNKYKRMMARRQAPSRKHKTKGSNGYYRAKDLAYKTSRKIRHSNDNWVHQVSRRVADRYDVVYLEDLNTKGMTRSAKGTKENPGTHVRQKKALNRVILQTGWHKLERALAYKTNIVKVPAHHTSQTCSRCGSVDRENRRSQSRFVCVACGYLDNADINAARNILARGIAESLNGRGELPSGDLMKRQKEHVSPDLVMV